MKEEESEPVKVGRHFRGLVLENLEDLDNRIHTEHKAALIVIDGGVGEGKTTLAVEVADEINSLHGLPEIDIPEQTQLAMGGEDFAKKLVACHARKLPVLIYDEAGDFNRRGALTRFNALLNRTFETFRAFRILVILVLPSMSVLDNDIFDKNIPRMLLRCHSRTTNQGNFQGFSLYRMLHIRNNMKKLIVKTDAYMRTEPNFQGHFKDLTPERSRQLDDVSTKGKLKELVEAEIKFKGLLSYTDIAKKILRGELWVKLAIKKLNIKPKMKHKRRYYYEAGVVDQLLDWMDQGGTIKNPKKGGG